MKLLTAACSLSIAVIFPRNGIAGGCGMGVVIVDSVVSSFKVWWSSESDSKRYDDEERDHWRLLYASRAIRQAPISPHFAYSVTSSLRLDWARHSCLHNLGGLLSSVPDPRLSARLYRAETKPGIMSARRIFTSFGRIQPTAAVCSQSRAGIALTEVL